MAYIAYQWQDYDVGNTPTSAANFNRMENGIAAAHVVLDTVLGDAQAAALDAGDKATAAAGSATLAGQKATEAAASAAAVGTVVTDAQAARDAAVTAKNTAATSATDATAAKTAAEAGASTATAKATEAGGKATAAAGSASTAADHELAAGQSKTAAQAAKADAESARDSAVTAKTAAEAGAATATTKAGEAVTSAAAAAQSAADAQEIVGIGPATPTTKGIVKLAGQFPSTDPGDPYADVGVLGGTADRPEAIGVVLVFQGFVKVTGALDTDANDNYILPRRSMAPDVLASLVKADGAAPASHTHTKADVGLGKVENLTRAEILASPTVTGTLEAPALKLTGGSPGAGKVWTSSDGAGNGSWTTPFSGLPTAVVTNATAKSSTGNNTTPFTFDSTTNAAYWVSGTANRILIPATGVYLVVGNKKGVSDYAGFRMAKNGTALTSTIGTSNVDRPEAPSSTYWQTLVWGGSLAAGDYLHFLALDSSGSPLVAGGLSITITKLA
ncbi:hypothetical protein O4215_20755 [Rhodococcus maanshanensis]|uniref:hypothetical protein n=1 Tax=Rhodococcus maanshanensis TaxID=183556 RepID=UPI0022B40ABE|nr:hypothetical protein [Rhodococcus maanshanensis]MCZ4557996.1 hypothetical protein [Rhodococcus maanshanensis]